MPSATANSGSRTRNASSFRSRALPMSVAAAARILTSPILSCRRPWRSPSKLQDRPADADTVARAHRDRFVHPLLVEERAVGRAEVLHEPLPVAEEQPRVEGGRVGVVQSDLTGLRPPDLNRLAVECDGTELGAVLV